MQSSNKSNSSNQSMQSIAINQQIWTHIDNQAKFQLIPIGKTRPIDIHICNQTIEICNELKILGLTITRTGFVKHIKNWTRIAKLQLSKFRRFQYLSNLNKTKFYLLLVRSKLLYPAIPLHASNWSQMSNMRKVQNSATRFIINARLVDHIISNELHRISNLEPINIMFHKQVQQRWNPIEQPLIQDPKQN